MTTPGTDVEGIAFAGANDPVAPAGAGATDVADLSFDDALAELQRTVSALEEGGLPLERTIELYERGAALHARCAMLLDEAELRIRRLSAGPGGRPVLIDEPTGGDPTAGTAGAQGEDQ